jgi:ISXO2-like transposase domain
MHGDTESGAQRCCADHGSEEDDDGLSVIRLRHCTNLSGDSSTRHRRSHAEPTLDAEGHRLDLVPDWASSRLYVACTNWAEEFFSRMRRAEIGHHHHLSEPYLLRFAQEASWREDNRRLSNGEQVHRVAGLAMLSKASLDFTGYWQRRARGTAHSPSP